MDYYQGIVIEYLRADRAMFVNTECCIQLKEGNPDTCGPHWYCDAVAVDFKSRSVGKDPVVYLCEISYSKDLDALLKRLSMWKSHWPELRKSLARDCKLPESWFVRPWVFIPEKYGKEKLDQIRRLGPDSVDTGAMAHPKITTLESVVPWNYRSWNRTEESAQPEWIPAANR